MFHGKTSYNAKLPSFVHAAETPPLHPRFVALRGIDSSMVGAKSHDEFFWEEKTRVINLSGLKVHEPKGGCGWVSGARKPFERHTAEVIHVFSPSRG